ncbi:MAG: hypothetical protein KF754_09810 [Planctomycetes bacterium]|nr:hypothetical protein [Planctomycetota bacterium]
MKCCMITLALCACLLCACGGDSSSAAGTAGQSNQAAGTDFSSPEAVFAAYSDATDRGDVEGIRRVLRPEDREMASGATGVSEANRGYTIVRREDRSGTEVCLHVKFKSHAEVMPHVLVRQDGKWYVDMQKTMDAMLAAGD